MSVSFSNSGENVIDRRIMRTSLLMMSDDDIGMSFQIEEIANWIESNGFKKVALQFSDELLCHSFEITKLLEKKTSALIAILADTSYGSCCVDEVAAHHFNVDSIVHFGYSCLSRVQRFPVFYVFGRRSIDILDCIDRLKTILSDPSQHALLLYDVRYHYAINQITSELNQIYANLLVPLLDASQTCTQSECAHLISTATQSDEQKKMFIRFGRKFCFADGVDINDYSIIFIGQESLFLNACMMTMNKCPFLSYDPESKTIKRDAWNINRQLMKRYYLVERAKDAERVGILAGTLGVSDYLQVIDRLSKAIRSAGKKCYKFVIGKLNVAKLANFAEVDVYVLVACPENSLIDSSEMYRPVVTPFEMELACDTNRHWTGDYEVDFKQLLPGGLRCHERSGKAETIISDVSLITGKIRNLGRDDDDDDDHLTNIMSSNSQLIKSNNQLILPGTAAEFLNYRSWTGLKPDLGMTPVKKVIEGSRGTAAGYDYESLN